MPPLLLLLILLSLRSQNLFSIFLCSSQTTVHCTLTASFSPLRLSPPPPDTPLSH
ncbi:unnamed protein product [Staurois parvus]|uniref:Secreted protein n=1 Tax=Staurois parvus TaxID=386267 RepID=A0ABN9D0W6_9NEOB|nr:unnamed protein product [Staurois parvus]